MLKRYYRNETSKAAKETGISFCHIYEWSSGSVQTKQKKKMVHNSTEMEKKNHFKMLLKGKYKTES